MAIDAERVECYCSQANKSDADFVPIHGIRKAPDRMGALSFTEARRQVRYSYPCEEVLQVAGRGGISRFAQLRLVTERAFGHGECIYGTWKTARPPRIPFPGSPLRH
jgi:hypothetical protein